MFNSGLILSFLTQVLAMAVKPSLRQVLPRMLRGMIVAGTAGYAAAARCVGSKIPRSEIKNFYNLCKSNRLSVDALQAALIHLLASQGSRRIVVAVDWTDIGNFKMLVFGVVIKRRTIPVFWWTIPWYENTVRAERSAFQDFGKLMAGWTYIVVADRGFGNVKLLRQLMDEPKTPFVIRVKSTIGIRRNVNDTFVPVDRIVYTRGHIQDLGRVDFTRSNTLPGVRIVRLHDMGQQEPWILATNLDAPARTIVNLYEFRFLIEETFRDGKDKSNGFALGGSRITDSHRLSRMFGIWTMTYVFLTLVGLHALKRR